ncbi:hypothetical protein B0J12DRAFT_672642 [Macrophomina phaseolina]|uniref:Uncharacterized protein n=1 Tax=Macrophomina phaseolina TaxID=35725 RepID=A0ABQ8G408_9PEZI|nr:hypothetical protein B0J12DRAFT_672642 [Macrophomina phaseolina]
MGYEEVAPQLRLGGWCDEGRGAGEMGRSSHGRTRLPSKAFAAMVERGVGQRHVLVSLGFCVLAVHVCTYSGGVHQAVETKTAFSLRQPTATKNIRCAKRGSASKPPHSPTGRKQAPPPSAHRHQSATASCVLLTSSPTQATNGLYFNGKKAKIRRPDLKIFRVQSLIRCTEEKEERNKEEYKNLHRIPFLFILSYTQTLYTQERRKDLPTLPY